MGFAATHRWSLRCRVSGRSMIRGGRSRALRPRRESAGPQRFPRSRSPIAARRDDAPTAPHQPASVPEKPYGKGRSWQTTLNMLKARNCPTTNGWRTLPTTGKTIVPEIRKKLTGIVSSSKSGTGQKLQVTRVLICRVMSVLQRWTRENP